MIYIATNYTDESRHVMQERFEKVTAFASTLVRQGHLVFSPITHGHPIAWQGNLPVTFDIWQKYALTMLAMCEKMIVFQQPGWEHSEGLEAEIALAESMGMVIERCDL